MGFLDRMEKEKKNLSPQEKHKHSFKVGDNVKHQVDDKTWRHSKVHAIIKKPESNDVIHVKIHSMTNKKGKVSPVSHEAYLDSTQVHKDTAIKNENSSYSDKLIEASSELLSRKTSSSFKRD